VSAASVSEWRVLTNLPYIVTCWLVSAELLCCYETHVMMNDFTQWYACDDEWL